MTRRTFYDRFDGCLTEKTIMGTTYTGVKVGRINPDDVLLGTVDAKTKTGNPRLWSLEKLLRKNKKLSGPFDADKIFKVLTDPKLGGKIAQGILALKEGLGETGEPAEPIILNSDGESEEGTRRTVASRLRKADGDARFNTIPCLVLPPNVPKEALDGYVGVIHVTQKAPWASVDRSAACAKYRDEYRWDIAKIAKIMNRSKEKVERYLRANDLYQEYLSESGDASHPEKWTKFWKVAGCVALHDRMFDQADEDFDATLWVSFKRWVAEGKITDCRHVADFTSAKIGLLNHPHAMKLVESAGTEKAREWVILNNRDNPVLEMVNNLCTTIDNLKAKDKKELASQKGAPTRRRIKVAVDALRALIIDLEGEYDEAA